MTRILVVDDEPLARERLVRLIGRAAPGPEVREASDGDAAVAAIHGWRPNVVFLDIQMPGRDGFAVVEAVGIDRMPPTVFVTAYEQHALKAFDVAAVDYLLKPFDQRRFDATWARVLQRLTAADRFAQRFLVRIGDRTQVVPVHDVRFIKSDGNYADLHTAAGTFTVRETLASLEQQLDPTRFVRIHRRVIVAVEHIRELLPALGGDQVLVLKDATTLRVSRTRREQLAARLAGISG